MFKFNNENEQDLVEDLIIESIEIHAEDFYYIPRKLVSPDEIFGEDRLSKFEHAYPIRAYFENVTNFDGQGAFIQRFGGFLDYSATLTLSRRKWAEWVGRYGQTILPNRPCEGDLIYYPLTDGLFEIKYVDDKNPFAQLGKFYTYKLTIELFQYSSEEIRTDIEPIDVFSSLKTFDINPDVSAWGGVVDVEIKQHGSGYKETPILHVSSIQGHGAQFEVELDESNGIKTVKILNPGESYASTDSLQVIGNCDTPAEIIPVIRTQVELAGDKWGSNYAFKEQAKEDLFDPSNPFGE